jgi:hypothetical protein
MTKPFRAMAVRLKLDISLWGKEVVESQKTGIRLHGVTAGRKKW